MQIDWSMIKKGPSVWVLNAEILKRESYVQDVKNLIENKKAECIVQYKKDKRLWWGNVKFLIKTHTVNFCRLLATCKRYTEKETRENLNQNDKNMLKIKELEDKLKDTEEIKRLRKFFTTEVVKMKRKTCLK